MLGSINNKSVNAYDEDLLDTLITKYAERMYVRKKTILYQQGETGNGFYYILDGLVKITTADFKNPKRILDICTSGELIGEQVLNGMPYFSTATILKNSVLYYISFESYNRLIQDYPEMKTIITNSIIDKMKLLLGDINVKSFSTYSQVAYYLVKLMDIYKNVEINLTQQELSDYTGLTRITIYKVLKEWEEDGVLQIKNRKIYILEPDLLKEYLGPY